MDLTLEQAKNHENNTYTFIPGRRTYSEINQFGLKYKEI